MPKSKFADLYDRPETECVIVQAQLLTACY